MPDMIPFSVLDLSPVPEGSEVTESLPNTLDLARHAERLGYQRYWLAEHHNMPGIASAATSVVIGHVAAGTTTIRVGAGGIMLPNHAPLVIAEQFGTLGCAVSRPHRSRPRPRAGHRQPTARALRRNLQAGAEQLPAGRGRADGLFPARRAGPARPGRAGRGLRRADLDPRLEPSTARSSPPCSACPTPSPRISRRREMQQRDRASTASASSPRSSSTRPYVMLGRERLRRRHGRRGAAAVHLAAAGLREPAHRAPGQAAAAGRRVRRSARTAGPGDARSRASCAVVGSPETVRRGVDEFIRRTGADELMVTAQIFDLIGRASARSAFCPTYAANSQGRRDEVSK